MHKVRSRFYSGVLAGAALVGYAAGTSQASITLISGGTAPSGNINNGGFESITGKSDFQSTTSSTAAIPYWGALTGANDGDSGAEIGASAITNSGTAGAFFEGQNGGAAGTGGGAFNLVTNYSIQTGDQFTLTYFTRNTYAPSQTADPITVTLFSQANPLTSSYSYSPIATLTGQNEALAPAPAGGGNLPAFVEYTLTYTATASDAGNDIGVTYQNNATDNSYTGADDFALTVTSVPEPASLALIGLASLGFLRRRARLNV